MLQAALAALRAGHDAHAALKLLDGYDARFPRGELRSEAALTRLDALLAAGDHPAALKLLGTMDAALSPRATELSVVRAELLAEAGQCAPAVALFRAADVVETPVLLRERSLYGWAICLGKLGDPQGSQARMEEYLARYPGGRFSDAVRQALGE